jgi:hypothetical protein
VPPRRSNDVAEYNLVTRPDFQCNEAKMQRAGPARRCDSVLCAQPLRELLLKSIHIIVTMLSPAGRRSVRHVLYFKFRYGRH